jgi:hypothetical protein
MSGAVSLSVVGWACRVTLGGRGIQVTYLTYPLPHPAMPWYPPACVYCSPQSNLPSSQLFFRLLNNPKYHLTDESSFPTTPLLVPSTQWYFLFLPQSNVAVERISTGITHCWQDERPRSRSRPPTRPSPSFLHISGLVE